MRAARFIGVVGISLLLAPLSYAQHGGGHIGFSGRGAFSSGHSLGGGRSSHSSFRFASGLRHIVRIPRSGRSPKPTAPSTDSVRLAAGLVAPQNSINLQFASSPTLRVGRGNPLRRPIIGTRPPPFPRPPLLNSCFGHAFCSSFGFGFASPLFCDPFFGFGRCFPFFGLVFGFRGDSLSNVDQPEDQTNNASGAADQRSTPAASSKHGAEPNHPITLLQLKNGWMYALSEYWVEGDNLRYVTSYGGKNSVPLDLIDFSTTIRLNSERGVELSLHTTH